MSFLMYAKRENPDLNTGSSPHILLQSKNIRQTSSKQIVKSPAGGRNIPLGNAKKILAGGGANKQSMIQYLHVS